MSYWLFIQSVCEFASKGGELANYMCIEDQKRIRISKRYFIFICNILKLKVLNPNNYLFKI